MHAAEGEAAAWKVCIEAEAGLQNEGLRLGTGVRGLADAAEFCKLWNRRGLGILTSTDHLVSIMNGMAVSRALGAGEKNL